MPYEGLCLQKRAADAGQSGSRPARSLTEMFAVQKFRVRPLCFACTKTDTNTSLGFGMTMPVVRHEDEDGHDVETAHSWVFQDLAPVQKHVSDGKQWDVCIISPEERQRRMPPMSLG